MAALAYTTYRAERHRWAGFELVHGHYDGLTTGEWTHGHMQVLVPLKGRLQLTWGAERHLFGPEGGVAIMPGTPHAATTLGGELEFLALNAPVEAGPPGMIALRDPGVWLAARQLVGALGEKRPGFGRMCELGAEALVLYVRQALAAPVAAPREPDPVERAVELVLRRYGEPLTVEGLASELAISPRHLERRFAAALGMPPRQFLVGVRLAAARDLLRTTGKSIEAVAESVGFGHPAHFTRAFKAATGMTPSAFRRARGGVT